MYWDVDGCAVVYYCMCGGDYRETAGDGTTIEERRNGVSTGKSEYCVGRLCLRFKYDGHNRDTGRMGYQLSIRGIRRSETRYRD